MKNKEFTKNDKYVLKHIDGFTVINVLKPNMGIVSYHLLYYLQQMIKEGYLKKGSTIFVTGHQVNLKKILKEPIHDYKFFKKVVGKPVKKKKILFQQEQRGCTLIKIPYSFI